MTKKEFLKGIDNIDVELLRTQRDLVIEMQESIGLLKRRWVGPIGEIDGLINVIDLIVDYIDPVVTSKYVLGLADSFLRKITNYEAAYVATHYDMYAEKNPNEDRNTLIRDLLIQARESSNIKYLFVDTWNGDMMDLNNGSKVKVFDDLSRAEYLAWMCADCEINHEDYDYVEDFSDRSPNTSLTKKYIYSLENGEGTYQAHLLTDDIYAVKILCNVNEVELLTKKEYDEDPANCGEDFVDDGQYYIKFVLVDDIHRKDKVKKIVDARINWTMKDYEEAYGDLWDEIPSSLRECQLEMKEYIYNTYDDALLDEILNDEVN